MTSFPADGVAYGWGEWIEVTVVMSEAVSVDVDGGTPLLALNVGGTGRAATFRGKSGDRTLVFRYLVQGGDRDDDGVGVIRNSLRLNDASIVAADGEAATLRHPGLSDQAGHEVNGVEPPPPEEGLETCQPPMEAVEVSGYRVFACFQTRDGETGYARGRTWSNEAGLLWFFDPGNVEVLIKVLDGCAVNGRRWVFLAPTTDLKLLVRVVAPDGNEWTYTNEIAGETARPGGDTAAFPCGP